MDSLERALSAEERIRRAEEIYQRRKRQGDVRVSSNHVSTEIKPNYFVFKKLLLQILICLFIYFIFYLIRNSNYIFSEDVLKKTREFLSYDINFQNVYHQAEGYLQQMWQQNIPENTNRETNELLNNEQQIQEMTNEMQTQETTNQETTNQETTNSQIQGGIGGGEEGEALLSNEIASTSSDEQPIPEEKELTQMEIDANEIKQNYSMILPLKGSISSRFGPREATEIVSANHAGIDIAANEGTIFIAAMEGKVTYVSSEGGYGNHIYIENNDVTTLYAHCSKIYVKEGDTITQGQQIGEVGHTGNTTGPHLHFEVRKENRVVNPEFILSFE